MSRKTPSKVAIIMGSKSDYRVMRDAVEILGRFKIDHEKLIISAHRTPKEMYRFSQEAHDRGFAVIIAGAGGSAHLPGMVASLTSLPVIGVPVTATKLKGLDSLLSIVQMPKGIPVATVAIDNAANAALLAISILGISDEKLYRKLVQYRKALTKKVKAMRI